MRSASGKRPAEWCRRARFNACWVVCARCSGVGLADCTGFVFLAAFLDNFFWRRFSARFLAAHLPYQSPVNSNLIRYILSNTVFMALLSVAGVSQQGERASLFSLSCPRDSCPRDSCPRDSCQRDSCLRDLLPTRAIRHAGANPQTPTTSLDATL